MPQKSKNNNESLVVEELKNKEKLLFFIHSQKFKKIEKDFIPISTELKRITQENIGLPKERLILLNNKMAEATECLRQVLRENHLPQHFSKSLFNYLVKDKMIFPMSRNFTIRVNPVIKLSPRGPLNYTDEIMLVTYSPLSTSEMRLAYKLLKYYWKTCFSHEVSKRTNLRDRDVDKKFLIEQAMRERRLKTEYAEDSYFDKVKRQYGEKTYKTTKKLNPKLVTIKAKKNTSNDVSKKFYGTKAKAGMVRVRFSRLNKRLNAT